MNERTGLDCEGKSAEGAVERVSPDHKPAPIRVEGTFEESKTGHTIA
jgi:hypothetical protein